MTALCVDEGDSEEMQPIKAAAQTHKKDFGTHVNVVKKEVGDKLKEWQQRKELQQMLATSSALCRHR